MGLRILSRRQRFRDRDEAGKALAEVLLDTAKPDPLVLGIPRGGVVIGFAIARALKAELDVAVTRKLRAPFNPELAIGAVMEGGTTYLNERIISSLRVGKDYLDEEIKRETEEIQDRTTKCRKVRPFVPRQERHLIVVDDGVATGATMIATLQGLRATNPASLFCALPVGPPDTLEVLTGIADEVICLCAPVMFQAVGQFYDDFNQVPDTAVIELLKQLVSSEER